MSKTIKMSNGLYLAMRSLHRLIEFQKLNASEFLLEQEKNIFLGHFRKLTPTEIQYLANHFDDYHVREMVEDELSNERIFKELTSYFNSLN